MYRQHPSCILLIWLVLMLGSFATARDALSKEHRIVTENLPSNLSATSPVRQVVTRQESGNRTIERRVLEGPSINGGSEVILEVTEDIVRFDDQRTERTRQEFGTDPDGRPKLIRSIQEERRQLPDGGERVVRDFSEPDLNGRLQNVRREIQETEPVGPGVDRTQIEVLTPSINRSGLELSSLIEQTERRQGDQLLESDRITYTTHPGSSSWEALERHVTQHEYAAGETRTVEQIYQPDASQNLSLSQQIVRKERRTGEGRQETSEEHYARDVPGMARSSEPTLHRQVHEVRTRRSDGGGRMVREIQELRVDRFVVVERIVEESRPLREGGVETEREVQRRDVSGNLRTVGTSRSRD